MTRRARRWLFHLVRVAICVAALWFVARGVTWHDRVELTDGRELIGLASWRNGDDHVVLGNGGEPRSVPIADVARTDAGEPKITQGLLSTWNGASKTLLLLAVLIHAPIVLMQAVRFRWLIGAQGIDLGFVECLKMALAGNFLNFAAPLGSNAGDVFKAYFASLHTPDRKTEAVATVILDRVIGLGSLVLVVAGITCMGPDTGRLGALRPYMLTMAALGGAGVAVYLSPWTRRLFEGAWLARRPGLRHVRRLDLAARTLASRRGVVLSAVGITVALQVVAMLAYFTVAAAMGLRAGADNMLELFAYFYTGTVVQALPGPPQGLGTVELAYRYFFSAFGSPSQIVSMALAIRVVVLVCALPGLLVTLTGAYRPRDIERWERDYENEDLIDQGNGGSTAARKSDVTRNPSPSVRAS